MRCPKCGATMLLREDVITGNGFYGTYAYYVCPYCPQEVSDAE